MATILDLHGPAAWAYAQHLLGPDPARCTTWIPRGPEVSYLQQSPTIAVVPPDCPDELVEDAVIKLVRMHPAVAFCGRQYHRWLAKNLMARGHTYLWVSLDPNPTCNQAKQQGFTVLELPWTQMPPRR